MFRPTLSSSGSVTTNEIRERKLSTLSTFYVDNLLSRISYTVALPEEWPWWPKHFVKHIKYLKRLKRFVVIELCFFTF